MSSFPLWSFRTISRCFAALRAHCGKAAAQWAARGGDQHRGNGKGEELEKMLMLFDVGANGPFLNEIEYN